MEQRYITPLDWTIRIARRYQISDPASYGLANAAPGRLGSARLQHMSGRFLIARAAWTKNPDFSQTSPTEDAETLEQVHGLRPFGKLGALQTGPYDHPIEDSIASRI